MHEGGLLAEWQTECSSQLTAVDCIELSFVIVVEEKQPPKTIPAWNGAVSLVRRKTLLWLKERCLCVGSAHSHQESIPSAFFYEVLQTAPDSGPEELCRAFHPKNVASVLYFVYPFAT